MALFKNKTFKNPHQKRINRSFFHYLLWFLGFYKDRSYATPMPKNFVYPNPKEERLGEYRVTWVNHSTFLIEASGVTFLTDPIFGRRCSPCAFLGPKRQHAPLPSLTHLPRIDYILISHNHYDHMDKKALQKLQKSNPNLKWVVPIGLKKWFIKKMKGVSEEAIIELNWHDSVVLSHAKEGIRCTAVPAQHFSGRGFFDQNCSLWMGVVVEVGEKRFYFAGDTGYNEVDFKEIGRRYKNMDLSLLPIGVYRPRGFMQSVHISPSEAVTIHEEVGSTLSVGGHWNTFRLSNEGLSRPPFDLYCALEKRGLSQETFRVLHPGQTISW